MYHYNTEIFPETVQCTDHKQEIMIMWEERAVLENHLHHLSTAKRSKWRDGGDLLEPLQHHHQLLHHQHHWILLSILKIFHQFLINQRSLSVRNSQGMCVGELSTLAYAFKVKHQIIIIFRPSFRRFTSFRSSLNEIDEEDEIEETINKDEEPLAIPFSFR